MEPMARVGRSHFGTEDGQQVSSEKAESLILSACWIEGYSGNVSKAKDKFTFYVLIPFMMIFSCGEYPILGTWRLVVDCFHVYPSLLLSLLVSHLYVSVPG